MLAKLNLTLTPTPRLSPALTITLARAAHAVKVAVPNAPSR